MNGLFKPKAVLFDMDGVLLDTEYVSREAWRKAAEAQGRELDDRVYNQIIGTNIVTARNRLREFFGKDFDFEAAVAARDGYVRSHRAKYGVAVKKGAVSLLNRLDELGVPYCVATSTAKNRAVSRFNDTELKGRFTKIIGGDCVVNGKPDPEIYLKAAAELNVPPEDCLAVEDSRLGTEAAYRAGAKVVIVPDIQPPDGAALARAYKVCKDLEEVAGTLFS